MSSNCNLSVIFRSRGLHRGIAENSQTTPVFAGFSGIIALKKCTCTLWRNAIRIRAGTAASDMHATRRTFRCIPIRWRYGGGTVATGRGMAIAPLRPPCESRLVTPCTLYRFHIATGVHGRRVDREACQRDKEPGVHLLNCVRVTKRAPCAPPSGSAGLSLSFLSLMPCH